MGVWNDLASEFAVEDPSEDRGSVKREVMSAAIERDPVAQFLLDKGLVLGERPDGRLFIECPWSHEHTEGVGDDSSTAYWPAHTGGYEQGHFKCLHASHAGRTRGDFLEALGYRDREIHDAFANLETLQEVQDFTAIEEPQAPAAPAHKLKFRPYWPDELRHIPMQDYHIKGVIPKAAAVVIYGPSGSGKSFAALDMAAAIALGQPWNGHRVKQTPVLYVAAEDSYGVVHRVHAYEDHFKVSLKIAVVGAGPQLMEKEDVNALIETAASIKAGVIIIDTLARTTAGGNENSSEDMGTFLKNIDELHKQTGATIVIIHHSGKDIAKGARGWSGIRAAIDAELEITRDGESQYRELRVTKQKNAEDGAKYGFELVQIELGVDADGDPITSCYCRWGAVAQDRKREKYKPKGAAEAAVLKALEIIEMSQSTGIEVEGVLDLAVPELVWDGEGRDQRRKNLRRTIKTLAGKGLFMLDGGLIELGSAGDEEEESYGLLDRDSFYLSANLASWHSDGTQPAEIAS